MNRRNFIKNTALTTAGIIASPYILPSGRLFASTGVRKVNHVVFCMFAGGIRNLESVIKADGNLMRNMLAGTETISGDIASGIDVLTPLSSTPLQTYGTLFKQFRYAQGPTGHFNGNTALITGTYTDTTLDIKTHPNTPTIFEYYRKHSSATNNALNAWWISNSLGPNMSLNFSTDVEYGAQYGANYMQPYNLFNYDSNLELSSPKIFNTAEQAQIAGLQNFFNKNFTQKSLNAETIDNTTADRAKLNDFFAKTWTKLQGGQYNNPWNLATGMNGDMHNVMMAEEVLKEFKPELLVVNMTDVDIAHSNFTRYCNNLGKADYAFAHLWQTIQSTPGLMNDTLLIAVPEHGRNNVPNSIVDAYGRQALDHTDEGGSREIFCMMLGPAGVINQNKIVNSIEGETIDIVPTIAHALGFDVDIPSQYRSRMGSVLNSAFV
ncbi:MAG: hypothetical protein ABL940_10200 [Bacteroidia bacterium]